MNNADTDRARAGKAAPAGPRWRSAAFAVALTAALLVLAGDATPARAQAGEPACDVVGAVTPVGGGAACDAARAALGAAGGGEDDGGGGGEDGSVGGFGEGSTEGSTEGSEAEGSGGGSGAEPSAEGPGADAGQGGTQEGRYGVWTTPIGIAQGLVFIAAGIGVGGGILVKATAGGNRDRHETAIHMLEGTLAGFLIGTLAIQLYDFLSRLVVGF